MGKYTITLIPGDGIGPEVIEAAVSVVEATGTLVSWERVSAGEAAFRECGTPLPELTIDSIRKNRIALKGPLGTPVGSGFDSVNVALRKMFDLYINFRPIKSFEGVAGVHQGVDLVFFRENTEELYAATEEESADGSSVRLSATLTRRGCGRIIRAAFDYARSAGRKRVTLVHKANILKKFYGLFLRVGREVARVYPDIDFNDKIVDNFSMQLVMNPHQFDVVVLTNLLGDILTDEGAGLVGGLGFLPSGNVGETVAIFEAVHGTAPDIAGRGIANPCAVILSSALMLRRLGEDTAAERIEKAVAQVLREGRIVTRDINKDNSVSTRTMTEAIVAAMRA